MTAAISRRDVAEVVLRWSREADRPLVVGNGFLAREVAAAGDGDHVFYLLAGMGLAPAIAAGFAAASGRPAAALEGDGNHLMGLPSTATIGMTRAPVLHVVHWNGGWESTGGQRLHRDGAACDVGPALGYLWTAVVHDRSGLEGALRRGQVVDGPALVHAVGQMGEPPATRNALTMAENARRFRRWATMTRPFPTVAPSTGAPLEGS